MYRQVSPFNHLGTGSQYHQYKQLKKSNHDLVRYVEKFHNLWNQVKPRSLFESDQGTHKLIDRSRKIWHLKPE
jgi:hypothetical protein